MNHQKPLEINLRQEQKIIASLHALGFLSCFVLFCFRSGPPSSVESRSVLEIGWYLEVRVLWGPETGLGPVGSIRHEREEWGE
jgi:hypothetical protein